MPGDDPGGIVGGFAAVLGATILLAAYRMIAGRAAG